MNYQNLRNKEDSKNFQKGKKKKKSMSPYKELTIRIANFSIVTRKPEENGFWTMSKFDRYYS